MSTREEIEAALLWYSLDDGAPLESGLHHLNTLAAEYFEYRATRKAAIERAAAEVGKEFNAAIEIAVSHGGRFDPADMRGMIADIITRELEGGTK